ncbi:hypothetical protein PENTCL1PPCAC_18678, partial [Pristionchus entomophagus]
CLVQYGNGICNRDCNFSRYGFDGGDCAEELRGTVTGQIQLQLALYPSDVISSLRFMLAFLAQVKSLGISMTMNKLDGRP